MNPTVSQPPPAAPPADLWRYQPLEGHYDEFVDDSGSPREAWRRLVSSLAALGPEEWQRRWEQGRRLIHENGVTYNVYGDPRGMDRPWQLDAMPLIISPGEWDYIEKAVVQRATLFNQILADLYGPQKLLHEGLLSPGVVFAGPGYLRPMRHIPVPNDTYLHLYAVDLARAPDGHWWVVNDRTQAPSGSGYALENRLVITRCVPDIFRDCRVQRLAEFFAKQRDMLFKLAPGHKENPRVVLLTPGPFNETYFEHAYLARYLGLTLVEGADLTVRDKRVYLKTLSGLLPVDVILRRQDDSFCDPLELRDDSMLGVPGLVQAIRAGTVAVANALGSGVADTPAIMAFLPSLCKALLGEELKMPSVATWWLGDEGPRQNAIDQIDQVVIKSAFPSMGHQVYFGDQLTDKTRAELLAKLRERPHEYIAQERVTLSTSPAWADKGLEPRHAMVRVFVTARADGSYMVMPGGLTRVSASRDSIIVSTQAGGGSKDTWVVSDKPVSNFSLLKPMGSRIELSRAGFFLSSRVADNLYWLGRYTERIDSTIRVVRCMFRHLTDETDFSDPAVLNGLSGVLVAQGRLIGPVDEHGDVFDRAALQEQLQSMLFDEDRPFSVRNDIQKAHRIVARVRDRVSLDSWRILNRLEDEFALPQVGPMMQLNAAMDQLDDGVLMLEAFAGQTMEGMTRENGWRFLDLGRRIERAGALHMLLRFGMEFLSEMEGPKLEAVLEIANSLMTYRSRYMAGVEAGPVLDLLMADESNPRSLAFQAAAMAEHIDQLNVEARSAVRSNEQRAILTILTQLRLAQIATIAAPDATGHRANLTELIDTCDHHLHEMNISLTRRYLSHARRMHHIVDLGAEVS
ncbi:MAG: circularly permuted type 2 ATP-grasp protein [Phycisphaeraceae bacterium]